MSGERGYQRLAGVGTGWTGHVTEYVGAITPSNSTVYDPPLRKLTCTVAGDVVIVHAGDSEAVSGNYDTQAMTTTIPVDQHAIRQVRATGTTATGLKGYR